MFSMTKEELIARISTTVDTSNENGQPTVENKLILLAPCGMVACSESEIIPWEKLKERGEINFFDLGLSCTFPEHADISQKLGEPELFIYCKDAEITTYSGTHFNAQYLCLSLKDIFGFSAGSTSIQKN